MGSYCVSHTELVAMSLKQETMVVSVLATSIADLDGDAPLHWACM